eukprot:2490848-Amphidinium_carterae.1
MPPSRLARRHEVFHRLMALDFVIGPNLVCKGVACQWVHFSVHQLATSRTISRHESRAAVKLVLHVVVRCANP